MNSVGPIKAGGNYTCNNCGAFVAWEGVFPEDCLRCGVRFMCSENLDELHGAAQAEFCRCVKVEGKLDVALDFLRAHGLDEEYEETLSALKGA